MRLCSLKEHTYMCFGFKDVNHFHKYVAHVYSTYHFGGNNRFGTANRPDGITVKRFLRSKIARVVGFQKCISERGLSRYRGLSIVFPNKDNNKNNGITDV